MVYGRDFVILYTGKVFDFLQIPSFYLLVHFGKNLVLHAIVSITCPTKLARLSLSMSMAKSIIFSKSKTMLFHLLNHFLKVKNLQLHDLVHHLPNQVCQVELVNVHCKVF